MNEQTKRCVTGADPDQRFPVPSDGQFDGMEYRDAPELRAVAEALIDGTPELADLAEHPPMVRYVWKQKAKKKQGKTVLGYCGKLSGLTRYYGRCDWTIEVGADICREIKATHFQIEALLFHELNHIEVVVDDKTGEVSYQVRGEDAYAFVSEIKRYGAWKDDLGSVAEAWNQAPLFVRGNAKRRQPDADGYVPSEPVMATAEALRESGATLRAGNVAVADRVNLVTADASR